MPREGAVVARAVGFFDARILGGKHRTWKQLGSTKRLKDAGVSRVGAQAADGAAIEPGVVIKDAVSPEGPARPIVGART